MYDLSSAETYVVYLPLLGDILELMPEKITEGSKHLIILIIGHVFMNVSFDDRIQMLTVLSRRLGSVQSFRRGFVLVSS